MFMTRLASSLVLVVLSLFTILKGGLVLAAVLLFLALVGYRELMKACSLGEDGRVNGLEAVGYGGIIAYYLLMVFSDDRIWLFLVLLMLLIAFMILYVFSYPRYRVEQVMCAFFNALYAPVMLSCIYLVRSLPYGIYSVWMIFISSWVCDSCAYLTGMLIGKHKMTPKLSPKKSIEGAIGGMIGSALAGGLFGYFVVEKVVQEQRITWVFAVIGAVGAMISQIGDLAASAIKRNYEIKDYGHLIPGHGGIMDRFDSVIFTAPMIYGLALLLIK